jgi:hypothetical protein
MSMLLRQLRKEGYHIEARQEAADLIESLQAEVNDLLGQEDCAIEINGKGYYIEPTAYLYIKSLQAEVNHHIAIRRKRRVYITKLEAEVRKLEAWKRYVLLNNDTTSDCHVPRDEELEYE